jgi:hypothetical protein
MDTKKLAQIIKVLVEAEVAKKQEHFLTKIFPKILEEEVNNKFAKLLKETKTKTPTQVKEVDPFALAEVALRKERQQVQNKQAKEFTKNPVLNEILNQTQPFSSAQRSGLGGGTSILDTYQQPIQEAASYVPSYMDAEPDIDETFTFNNPVTAQVGLGAMRNQMAEKMGYGDFGGGAQRGGLGVKTGNEALDKALNRDYSQLVKRFNK